MSRGVKLLREALLSAASSVLPSLLTILVVAVPAVTILMTSGKADGIRQAVVASIDDVGTRTVVFRIDAKETVTADVVANISELDRVEWAAGFGEVNEAFNVHNPDGMRVGHRVIYTDDVSYLGVDPERLMSRSAGAQGKLVFLPPGAKDQLGLVGAAGGVQTSTGAAYSVAGTLGAPPVEMLTNVALSPVGLADGRGQKVVAVAVAADAAESVALVESVAKSMLGVSDPANVKVETSRELAALRGEVQGQLANFSQSLVLGVVAVTAVLETAVLYGFVMMRRKDYGRRRALGASQTTVIGLVLCQVGFLALIGASVGVAIGLGVLLWGGDPLPGLGFTAGTWLLSVAVGTLGAVIPAWVAAGRDPLVELRVP